MNYINLIVISLAIASISFTVTKSDIFRPFRLFTCKHSNSLGKLISCPYCFSHWVALFIMGLIYKSINLDFIIMTFAAITLSTIWVGMMSRALDFLIPND